MRKYLIATHGELAKGFQSSLNILADKGNDFQVINAYIIDEDYTPAIDEFIFRPTGGTRLYLHRSLWWQ